RAPPLGQRTAPYLIIDWVALLMVVMPSTVFYLLLVCRTEQASALSPPWPLPSLRSLWSPQDFALVLAWLAFQALLYWLPIGKITEGSLLRDKSRLQYRINGFYAMLVTALVLGAGLAGGLRLSYIYDHILQLAFAATVLAFGLSVLLYFKALLAPETALAPSGNSGRASSFLILSLFEDKPVFIAGLSVSSPPPQALINMAMLVKETELRGSPSLAMILVNAFQFLYVVDALWHEEAVLTTMDIVQDGFGFMLAYGDLAWVPFLYSLQSCFLVTHPQKLSLPLAGGIVLLNALGYSIFRGANSQKNTFRRNPADPRVAGLRTIPTATGRRLLVSGWWGFVRHPNYLGDLIMAFAWSLPCGFTHILPYFYILYFTLLLAHRDARDEHQCRRKYGLAWQEYCRRVPYRIVPYLY
uniref:Delta(14)-sterol reductase TM7SF2 n=1 Tax=Pseudonaja textilis TaxID=8673 RepID=A0A670ZLQ1_PSETE